MLEAPRNPRRRRARIGDSNESSESYEPPEAPRRIRRMNLEAEAPLQIQNQKTEIDKVQQLLRKFGAKLKYQRFPDNYPKPQPPMIITASYKDNLMKKKSLSLKRFLKSRRILLSGLNLKLESIFISILWVKN